jgi:2-C-methyl-D-erythritol 4-phosphate cytidylyltransferase
MRAVALLAAAGVGQRLGGDVPKALLRVSGRSLLDFAVETIDACREVEGLVVAAPPDVLTEVGEVAKASEKLLAVVEGGESRHASIRNALEAVPHGFDAVVCHDVARPFAPPELFTAVLTALDAADGAVPTLPVQDTVKRVRESLIVETLPRDGLALAQTPQGFRLEALEAAHRAAVVQRFEGTDDSVVVERSGYKVVSVPGDSLNLKLTTAADLRVAAALVVALRG